MKHEFIDLLAGINRDTIVRLHALDPEYKLEREQIRKLSSQAEKYVIDVFLTATGIIGTVEQLRFVPIFLRNFPRRKRFQKYGINHPKYLQYHFEIHFIKIATVLDQMAILIDKVYRLGIPERKCSIDSILENDHTKYSYPAKLLKAFDKSIQGVKSVRNLIVHRGVFDDEDLNQIGMFYYLAEHPIPDEEVLFDDFILRVKTRFTIKKKLATIVSNNQAVDTFVSNCFQSLVNEFKRQHKFLLAGESST